MTDLFVVGASALRAYRASLGVVGDNIANANTQGYVRRTVRLDEVAIAARPNFLYRNRDRFDGVDIGATLRMTDAWRTADARIASSALGRADASADWLQAAETALDDGNNGVGAQLAGLFAAADTLAADPAGRQPRSAFLTAVDDVAASVRNSAIGLAQSGAGVSQAAASDVATVNADLDALAGINLAIRHAAPGTATFAELSDQRDHLIDGIASLIAIDVDVSADGTVKLIPSGVTIPTLVFEGTATPLSVTIAGDGRLGFGAGAVTLTAASGALAGLASTAGTIADRRASLDALATTIAVSLNAWHATGQTPGGSAGSPLLALPGDATTLTAVLSDPDEVAAASAGVANGNALALGSLRAGSGVEAGWAALVTTQAQATAAARSDESRAAARNDTAAEARDVVEGVDLDREAADLLRYQQAYEGAARVIQTAKETVDTIFALF